MVIYWKAKLNRICVITFVTFVGLYNFSISRTLNIETRPLKVKMSHLTTLEAVRLPSTRSSMSINKTLLNIFEGVMLKFHPYSNFDHLDFDYVNSSQQVNEICSAQNSSTFVMVFVNSAAHNFDQRDNIRNSWGSSTEQEENNFRLVFIVALGKKIVNERLSSEIQQFNDTIQGNFTESYHDMVRKLSMCFHWFNHFCKKATYFLKTDDDMILNMKKIILELKKLHVSNTTIICGTMTHFKPHRLQNSKWFVSEIQFPRKYYPPFCRGSMVIMAAGLASKLYSVSPFAQYVWLEDVFWTGLIPEKLGNVKFISWNKHGRYPSSKSMKVSSFIGARFMHMTIPGRTVKLWRRFKDLKWGHL